jgi:hypothetical protein
MGHPPEARVAAVSIMTQVANGQLTFAAAVHKFEEEYNSTATTKVADVRKFLERWSNNWSNHTSVADAPRTGRTPKINHEKGIFYAAVFKGGEQQPPDAEGRPQPPIFYTSIQDAIARNSVLKEALVIHRCSPLTLFRAIMAADESICLRKIVYKTAFQEQDVQERVRLATQYMGLTKKELDCTIFGDGASITVDYEKLSFRVYCDRNDPWMQSVREAPAAEGSKPVTVKFFVWVNAKCGVMRIDICSGTTKIDRGTDWRPKSMRHQHYQVSMVYPSSVSTLRVQPVVLTMSQIEAAYDCMPRLPTLRSASKFLLNTSSAFVLCMAKCSSTRLISSKPWAPRSL